MRSDENADFINVFFPLFSIFCEITDIASRREIEVLSHWISALKGSDFSYVLFKYSFLITTLTVRGFHD